MRLYHLTAVAPGGVTLLAHGSFTAPRLQELVTASGSSLELYRLHHAEGRLHPLMRVDAFAQIRAIDVFRLPGTRRDYLVVTSDSGSISILSADAATATFKRIHCETFGKSGCRRIIPGQFLACEPRGRACMVAAVEKQKFAYVLNRDSEENLTISSPLEAHKSNCVTFALVSLDVGFENPMFASLERSYEDDSQKLLVYYELDLGLNHVVRKHTAPVRESSFVMLPVPGHTDGPGGVLICSSGFVTYRSLLHEDEEGRLLSVVNGEKANGQKASKELDLGRLEVKIPYRKGTKSESTMIVSGTVYQDKKGDAFFFLLCTELGDLIKAELNWDSDNGATELRLVYFDSLPGPVLGMRIFRSGFLAVAVEGSDSLLMKFREANVPDDDPAGGLSVSRLSIGPNDAESNAMDIDHGPNGTKDQVNGVGKASGRDKTASATGKRLSFKVRDKLSFLTVTGVFDSLAPLLSICSTENVPGKSNGLLCSTGRAKSGGVRALRRGMAVMEMSSPHVLPAKITDVFAFKDKASSEFHRFIVVSFKDRTKVLKVGETRVEEIFDSGFELGHATLGAAQMSTDSLVQIYRDGVRYIPGGRADDAKEWKPPVPSKIVAACSNQAQIVIALSTGDLVYFEVYSENGTLQEIEKIPDVFVPSGGDDTASLGAGDDGVVPSLTIPRVPKGRSRASFFAAGDSANNKVRLFQVGLDSSVQALGLHVAPAPVESLALVDFGFMDDSVAEAASGGGSKKKSLGAAVVHEPNLTLLIGTSHGALVRLSVDSITGAMSGKRSTFLGLDPVRVEDVRIAGVPTCLAMGSSTWMMYPQGGRIASSPLCTERMEHAASFSSEQSPDGFVCVSGAKLRLLSIDLLHALTASGGLPEGLAASAVPGATSLGTGFYLARTRTDGTPRRIVPIVQEDVKGGEGKQEGGGLFVVVETDHRASWIDSSPTGEQGSAARADEVGTPKQLLSKRKKVGQGLAPGVAGQWVSKMQLVKVADGDSEPVDGADDDDDLDGSNVFMDLSANAVTCMDTVVLASAKECILTAVSSHILGGTHMDAETVSYLVVSIARNVVVSATAPTSAAERHKMEETGTLASGALRVYRVDRRGKLVFLHETPVQQPVYAMAAFRDMLLVGTGQALRLYELGKRQLLRKGEYRLAVQNRVCALAVSGGDRFFVGDVRESVTLFRYIPAAGGGDMAGRAGGKIVPVACDGLPRWIVSLIAIDYSTVCASDKFGNVIVLRLPSELSGAAEEYAGGAGRGGFGPGSRTAPHRLSVEACFHVGCTVVSLAHACIRGGGGGVGAEEKAIVYGTVQGGVGVLAALTARADAEFARKVEREVRLRYVSVCGRDHVAYRGSFYPVKNVVDGDLCEMMAGMGAKEKEECSEAIGRPAEEVLRKLEDLRTVVL